MEGIGGARCRLNEHLRRQTGLAGLFGAAARLRCRRLTNAAASALCRRPLLAWESPTKLS